MPRAARIKSYDSIYHIMCKSINNAPLFRDIKDKDKYISLIKKYQERFQFKVYGYCLMTTHVHMIIDCNGADISKIMHSINQCYAQYFNIKHDRNGHVFQDRFKSKIIQDDKYLITLLAYIHNNPVDMKKFKKCPEKYIHSSYGVYLGIREDKTKILDDSFILGLFGADIEETRRRFRNRVLITSNTNETKEFEFKNDKSEYRSERVTLVRDIDTDKIMNFVAHYTKIQVSEIKRKNRREVTESRALCAFLIRCFCDFNYKDIWSILGAVTLSRISGLVNKGVELIKNDERYTKLPEKFLEISNAS